MISHDDKDAGMNPLLVVVSQNVEAISDILANNRRRDWTIFLLIAIEAMRLVHEWGWL